jgi:long-chain acyl-CoA synthetase
MRRLICRGANNALVGRNIHLSYNELLRQINNYTTLFENKSFQRIAIFSENRPEWIFAYYAILKSKGIAVPIDFMSSSQDVAYILKDCQPVSVFVSGDKLKILQEAMQKANYYPTVHLIDKLNLSESSQTEEEFYISDIHATAMILYTSGTTGNPKGVMLSYNNIFTNLDAVCHHVKIYTPDDRVMALLPLHHIFPLMGTMIAPLYVGATIVLNTSLAADEILATLQQHHVTIMIGVPRLYQLFYKGLKEKIRQNTIAKILLYIASLFNSRKVSRLLFASVHKKFGGSIKYLVSGGASIDSAVVKLFLHLGFEFLEGYGMTETAPMITFTRPGAIIPGIPGQALHGVKIKIVNDEIVVAGNNVMQGYYNKPQDTAEILKNGWLFTGDLGYLDKKGYLHVTGRKKDIIVLSNGKNINPVELEESLSLEFEEIKECGVFMLDGVLQAVILPDYEKLNNKGIKDYDQHFRWNIIETFNHSVAPYKRIFRFYLTTSELPKTRLGKLKRYELERFVIVKNEVAGNEPSSHEYKAIKAFLEDETQQKVLPHHHIELDLMLDSLGKVSFSAFIETAFGIIIKENTLADFPSIEKLAEYIASHKIRHAIDSFNWSKILHEKIHVSLPESWFTHNLFKNISRILFRLFMRIKSEGLENIPDSPCIIAPNHQSILDGFLIVSFFNRKFIKNTFVYAKKEHFKSRILHFLAKRNNIILVDINKDLKLSIQKLAAVLKKGKNLLIFPEGTRTLNGHIGEFKQTFAILSRELNIPVVPVAIKGTYNILPSGARFPRFFKSVTVSFLTPVNPQHHNYESLKNAVYNHVALKLSE